MDTAKEERLNVDLLKELTGGDSFFRSTSNFTQMYYDNEKKVTELLELQNGFECADVYDTLTKAIGIVKMVSIGLIEWATIADLQTLYYDVDDKLVKELERISQIHKVDPDDETTWFMTLGEYPVLDKLRSLRRELRGKIIEKVINCTESLTEEDLSDEGMAFVFVIEVGEVFVTLYIRLDGIAWETPRGRVPVEGHYLEYIHTYFSRSPDFHVEVQNFVLTCIMHAKRSD